MPTFPFSRLSVSSAARTVWRRLTLAAYAVALTCPAHASHGAATEVGPVPQSDDPAPTISSFSPASAPAGQSVTILGSGFLPPLSVTFGGNVGSPSFGSVNGLLNAFIPSGAQTGPITISAAGGSVTSATNFVVTFSHYPFFTGEAALSNGVYYLELPNGNPFGYYSYLADQHGNQNVIYHFDLGYEYVLDAADGQSGVYLYDFASSDFFYTSPTFPFPYLYDFNLNSVVYYYPNPTDPQHYNTNGVRYFYVFNTGQIISK